jgi:hypothetical protein
MPNCSVLGESTGLNRPSPSASLVVHTIVSLVISLHAHNHISMYNRSTPPNAPTPPPHPLNTGGQRAGCKWFY